MLTLFLSFLHWKAAQVSTPCTQYWLASSGFPVQMAGRKTRLPWAPEFKVTITTTKRETEDYLVQLGLLAPSHACQGPPLQCFEEWVRWGLGRAGRRERMKGRQPASITSGKLLKQKKDSLDWSHMCYSFHDYYQPKYGFRLDCNKKLVPMAKCVHSPLFN